MDVQLKSLLEELEAALNRLRPHTRQEFQDALGAGAPGVDRETFRKRVFDYERAPYIEKRGLDRARQIVVSVPPDAYPEPGLFLLTCLQRLEAFLFEQVRPAGSPAVDADSRTLMYRMGIRKVIRAVAGRLPPERIEVWSFRRGMLDGLEEELWRRELGIAEGARAAEAGIVELGESLLSLSVQDLGDFASKRELADWFIRGCGEPARKLVENIIWRGSDNTGQ